VNAYKIGEIQLKGIRPTDDFLEFAEKERLGIANEEDYQKVNPRGYFVPVNQDNEVDYGEND